MAAVKKATPNLDVGEICAAFRQAKDKREQINILGDLNLCAPRTIAGVLYRAGELEGTGLTVNSFSARYDPIAPAKARKPRLPDAPFPDEEARRLFAQGLDDVAIADRLGVPIYRVQIWRSENGLRRDYDWSKDNKLLFKPKEGETVKKSMEDYHVPVPGEKVAPPLTQQGAGDVCTVEGFIALLMKHLQPVLGAEISLNGERVDGLLGYEVKVRNDRVYVDVRTKEA